MVPLAVAALAAVLEVAAAKAVKVELTVVKEEQEVAGFHKCISHPD